MTLPEPLQPEKLRRRCDSAAFGFETSDELADMTENLGQSRAHEALSFAAAMAHPGYNVFVIGEPGSGRHFAVRRMLEERATSRPQPSDWCYVNNFAEPNRPRALKLPPGRGQCLRRDMQRFVVELAQAITAAFESEEFSARIGAIQQEFKKREENSLQALGKDAAEQGVALLRTPHGFVFAPVQGDETMSPDEFEKLPDNERQRLRELIEALGGRLEKVLGQFPRWRREMQSRIKQASRDTMSLAAGHLIEELEDGYRDLPEVIAFLEAVRADVVEVGEELRTAQKSDADGGSFFMSGSLTLQRYQVNLLVDHSAAAGAPVVSEDNPTYPNLIGRVDNIAHMGTLVTNFTLIRAGALHQANGGYLMVDAAKLLGQPFAWEGLKRALRARQIRIESLGQAMGFVSTLPLEPEPIPLDLKVVLFGERRLYYLLAQYDPELAELIKVVADFSDHLPRSDDQTSRYCHFIATLARAHDLKPFHREAVAAVVEQGARIAGDAQRLTLRTRRLVNLMCEADHMASLGKRPLVTAEDVGEAVAAQIRRADRVREEIGEAMLRDTLLISTSGSRVGQVNGLAVFELSDMAFAHPVRISATARLGDGDVIDIEREAELGGAIHSKGVMILSAFLGARYARELPLALSASIVFEQSYGPVEGDSASLAELCALLSALAGVPIMQSLAVTGSVNQYGAVQAIGGVNEKIEGFFDICAKRGLTGEQGVIIPQANVQHLMLRADVVEAARAGRFRVYAVAEVDEAISLLTGIPAGEADAQGLVPEGTINFLVASQLAQLSVMRQRYGGGKQDARAE